MDHLKIREVITDQAVTFRGKLLRIKGYARLIVGLTQFEVNGDYEPKDLIDHGIVYPYKTTTLEVIGNVDTIVGTKVPQRLVLNKGVNSLVHVLGNVYSAELHDCGPIAPQIIPLNANGGVQAGYNTLIGPLFDLGVGNTNGYRRVKMAFNAKHGSTTFNNNVINHVIVVFEGFGAEQLTIVAYQHGLDQVDFDFVSPFLIRQVLSINIRFNVTMIVGANAVYAVSLTGEEVIRKDYVV